MYIPNFLKLLFKKIWMTSISFQFNTFAQNCTLLSLCMELPSMHSADGDICNTLNESWVSVHALFWNICILLYFLNNVSYYYEFYWIHNTMIYYGLNMITNIFQFVLFKQLFYIYSFPKFITYFYVFVNNLVIMSLIRKSINLCFLTLKLDILSSF